MKTTTIILAAIVFIALLGGVGYYMYQHRPGTPAPITTPPVATTTAPVETTTQNGFGTVVIGKSVEGRDITAYQFGTGTTELLFVGGLHGGYEWNTVLVAYNLVDYLQQHPEAVPANEKVTVIPVVNTDGLTKTVGTSSRFTLADVPTPAEKTIPGRFNANTVDLNRNFDCDWQASGMWQKTSVSGGSAPFSEPESKAIKAYVDSHTLSAVVVWYSSAGGVFSSNCHNGVLPETAAITKVFGKASGYPDHESFNFYEITGDMVNWLAKQKIPAISVLLTNHQDVEWDKNKLGVDALLKYYAK